MSIDTKNHEKDHRHHHSSKSHRLPSSSNSIGSKFKSYSKDKPLKCSRSNSKSYYSKDKPPNRSESGGSSLVQPKSFGQALSQADKEYSSSRSNLHISKKISVSASQVKSYYSQSIGEPKSHQKPKLPSLDSSKKHSSKEYRESKSLPRGAPKISIKEVRSSSATDTSSQKPKKRSSEEESFSTNQPKKRRIEDSVSKKNSRHSSSLSSDETALGRYSLKSTGSKNTYKIPKVSEKAKLSPVKQQPQAKQPKDCSEGTSDEKAKLSDPAIQPKQQSFRAEQPNDGPEKISDEKAKISDPPVQQQFSQAEQPNDGPEKAKFSDPQQQQQSSQAQKQPGTEEEFSPVAQKQQQQQFLQSTIVLMSPPPPPQQVFVEIPRTPTDQQFEKKVDIFPILNFDEVPKFDLNMPCSPSGIRTFINILKGHRVYFHVVDSKHWTANIERHYSQSQQCKPIVFDKLDWAKVEKRLMIRPTSDRHNEDLRLVHRWENVYLAKAYFTFGQRCPDPQTCHVIQTSAAPLLFYQLDQSKKFSQQRDDIMRKKKRFSRTVDEQPQQHLVHKGFSSYDQYLHERYVLQPFSIYRVSPGTKYVLLTYQKTLFRVDVVPESVADSMEARGMYRFASPTSDRVLCPNSSKGYCVAYSIAPPTPIALPSSTQQQQQLQEQPQEQYLVSELNQTFSQVSELNQNFSQDETNQNFFEEWFGTQQVSDIPCATATTNEMLYVNDPGLVIGEQQQQQYTLYLQPQQPPPLPETRDAAVNTELPLRCDSCPPRSTQGLGIAKKKISSCSDPDDCQQASKKSKKYDPLDLSCGGRRIVEPLQCSSSSNNPAPKQSFQDSGFFQILSEDEELSSSDDEPQDDGQNFDDPRTDAAEVTEEEIAVASIMSMPNW